MANRSTTDFTTDAGGGLDAYAEQLVALAQCSALLQTGACSFACTRRLQLRQMGKDLGAAGAVAVSDGGCWRVICPTRPGSHGLVLLCRRVRGRVLVRASMLSVLFLFSCFFFSFFVSVFAQACWCAIAELLGPINMWEGEGAAGLSVWWWQQPENVWQNQAGKERP